MARKKKFTEEMVARFPPGTFARINAVIGETEDRTDFVREAVAEKLAQREQERGRRRKKPDPA